jgi:hypothetical protein
MDIPELLCGYPDQWEAFRSRHLTFLERLPNLKAALDLALCRSFTSTCPADRLIFTMGHLCAEDFWEVGLLCANGYGVGALKLLRSFYEVAVTMAYLSKNPSEVDDFLDYHWVSQHKLVKAIEDSFGAGRFGRDIFGQTKEEYARVKDNFRVPICKKCGTPRMNHNWNKLDMVSMAKKTRFGADIIPGYYEPMMQAHSTVHAIISRFSKTTDDLIKFDQGAQPEQADRALMTAHRLILGVLVTHEEFFRLKTLELPLQTCRKDFLDTWRKENPDDPSEIYAS